MLNISQFFKGAFNFKRAPVAPLETVTRYSYEYESAKKLYDIIDIDGIRNYRINGFKSEKTIYHKAIEEHFSI